MIKVNVDGKPSNNATINYYLSNSNGNVVIARLAKPVTNALGSFSINLDGKDTAKLSPGPNTLKIFANSFEAYKPDIITKLVIALRTMGPIKQ
jgi:peptide/nickel transport system substrate-binding protein